MRQPALETERLILRPFSASDARQVQMLAGDERVADVTANIPHPYPDGAADSWIATHPKQWELGMGIAYAITLKADDLLIGAVSVHDINNGEGELGYWIGVPYWGQGYCTEAVQGLLSFMKTLGWVHRLQARCLVRNPASDRVLNKTGFVQKDKTTASCGYRKMDEAVTIYEQQI